MSVKIYHNPRCSKSRQTLELLTQRGIKPEIIEYLKTPPTRADIQSIAKMLGVNSVREFMRTSESIYKELNLAKVEDESKLVTAIVENPKLLERPIVINGKKAAIGRPPESVLAIL